MSFSRMICGEVDDLAEAAEGVDGLELGPVDLEPGERRVVVGHAAEVAAGDEAGRTGRVLDL